MIELAVEHLLNGNYRCVVARSLGITMRSWQKWCRLGKQFPEGIYGQFLRAVEGAEHEFHTRAIAAITSAGKTEDPRLLMEFMARKHPELYGRYRGELGELKRRIAELEKLLGGDDEATSPVPA